MSDETVVNEPQQMATEALKPGKFRFIDALKGRSYPSEEVTVYLDEAAAVPLIPLFAERANLRESIDRIGKPEMVAAKKNLKLQEQLLADVEAKMAEISAQVKARPYVISVHGVSNGTDEDSLKTSFETYPVEYRENINVVTGATTREEIESPERNKLYTNLQWQSRISKIVDADGNVDDEIDLETAAVLRRTLPTASLARIEQAIKKVNMAVNWYDALVDESFLVKS